MKIAILGAGHLADALGSRWAEAGHHLMVAGRTPDKAARLTRKWGAETGSFTEAARSSAVAGTPCSPGSSLPRPCSRAAAASPWRSTRPGGPCLPGWVLDGAWVAVVASLLEYVFEAGPADPSGRPRRRRVLFTARNDGDDVVLQVRDLDACEVDACELNDVPPIPGYPLRSVAESLLDEVVASLPAELSFAPSGGASVRVQG